ncbi:MAG: hypothetical protein LBP38_02095 [Desulfovibrio sp.]|jgi:uncharacterized Zn finger protein|nr:hypothetical protein [Desulfovibrio sp.]
MSWWYRHEYVSVEEKRRKAARLIEKLRKERFDLRPIRIEGRLLSRTFWGKEWCRQMDLTADYDSRLPRGRSYVRNGAVCHLEVRQGEIHALVSGSELYTVTVRIAPLPPRHWALIQDACKEKISTFVDLLQGKLSKEVMSVVCHPEIGIFPKASEISYECSCPDWAGLCKHTAATLYGVGSRLDEEPELLFLLRHVDPLDLFSADVAAQMGAGEAATLQGVDLGGLFGINLEEEAAASGPGRSPLPAHDAPPAAQQAVKRTGRQAARQAAAKTAAQTTKHDAQQTGRRPAKQPAAKTTTQAAKHDAQQPGRQTEKRTGRQTARQAAAKTATQAAKRDAQQTGRQAAALVPDMSSAQAPARPSAQKRTAKRKRAGSDTPPALPVLDFAAITGADVTALREASGLSPSAFVYRLDVAHATLERWEKSQAIIVMQQASRKKLQALYKKLQRKFAKSR